MDGGEGGPKGFAQASLSLRLFQFEMRAYPHHSPPTFYPFAQLPNYSLAAFLPRLISPSESDQQRQQALIQRSETFIVNYEAPAVKRIVGDTMNSGVVSLVFRLPAIVAYALLLLLPAITAAEGPPVIGGGDQAKYGKGQSAYEQKAETQQAVCSRENKELQDEIEKAKHCDADSDCILADLATPFGRRPINRAEHPRLNQKTFRYFSKCGGPELAYPKEDYKVHCLSGKCAAEAAQRRSDDFHF